MPAMPAMPACLPACVPVCVAAWLRACGLAWPALGLTCAASCLAAGWPGWPGWPGCLAACLQRMHSAEAISMHTVWLMARGCPLCKQAYKSTVKSVQSLFIVWWNETMCCLHEEAHKRIFHCASMESKQAREEGMPALSKKGKTETRTLPPKITSATVFPLQQNAPRRRPGWQANV